jgi:predicted nucleic acid-binding protein
LPDLPVINFVNEKSISLRSFIEFKNSATMCKKKDTPFVVLTLELEGELWTKDNVLRIVDEERF